MNRLIIVALLCMLSFTACKNNNKQNVDIEPILTLESTSTPNDSTAEKGSINNPYDGRNESFQITCQAPNCGKESEIVLEFSDMGLINVKHGWMIEGLVTFVSGNNATPIHLSDYVTVQYYNKDGMVGLGYNIFLDSDSEGKELIFKKNNLIEASIHNTTKLKDFNGNIPTIGCIQYHDGTEPKEVFFGKLK
ncbi:hypothetical protein [Anaerosporobacter sp.]|uniref:hypothetical protein n=1 Tax=Anaerosporobacter sp. TaxID=1872529 RepID=UPI00286F67D7|nr:hypothetical protein [Anaerosporobacter sp.]